MSRAKIEKPPRTTLVFMIEAPMSMSATASVAVSGLFISYWFWRAKASTSTTTGVSPASPHPRHILVDLGFLDGDQHHIHRAALAGRLSHDLVVEVDVVDGKVDVMVGLQHDRVVQLLRGDLGELVLLH